MICPFRREIEKKALDLVVKAGRGYAVLFVTLISVVVSVSVVCLTAGQVALANLQPGSLSLLYAVVVPLVTAPMIAWPMIGLLLKASHMEAEMRSLALTDPLTQLFNRRYFLQKGESHLALAYRLQRPLSVIIVDIDHFKRVNDRFGHAVGDEALKLFARSLHELCRETDIVGRIGGEEFAVLLPDTDVESAARFCKRLHQNIDALELRKDGQVIHMTFSAGIRALSPVYTKVEDVTLAKLLSDADKALYRAKEMGRNQSQIAGGLPGRECCSKYSEL